jgi:hypothetical protein
MMNDDVLARLKALDTAARVAEPARRAAPSSTRVRRRDRWRLPASVVAACLLLYGAAQAAPAFWRNYPGPAGILAVGLLAYLVMQAGRFYVRKYHLFLLDYVRWALTPAEAPERPIHIFFLYTDHFEAGTDDSRTARWAAEYDAMARRHRDADGRHPQHTWFFPIEQPYDPHMARLQKLVADGLGEVEVHLHHNFDTAEGLEAKIREGLAYFGRFGFARTIDGENRFAFVHGLSGLDNSNGDAMCGVERELEVLKKLGCFADFTFPSIWEDSQPPFVNTIYEAVEDDGPKSYRTRHPAVALGRGDLTIFQGPLLMVPSFNPLRLFLEIEDGNIHPAKPTSHRRVDQWIRANIHLPGRPDWVFVKVFGHSASSDDDQAETVGPNFDAALTYLEQRYNDGTHYVLHYVTAREAYNLARAAAAGQERDPSEYYDWIVKPYVSSAPRTPVRAGDARP